MRRCFLYCAVFPKDSIIDVQELIRMWMAQGYLHSSGKVEPLESRGYEWFSNLAMRSLFQNLERDPYDEAQISSCKMHNIVHDFAQHLTTGECCIIENLDKAKNLSSGKVRHLTLRHAGDVDRSSQISSVGKLRSFQSIDSNCDIVGPNMFDWLKCARVLTLNGTNLREVPRAIGELIHLRYLDLSENDSLIELPQEICDLYNLETLNISECERLSQFPQRIRNLVNLRHLPNSETSSHKQFSQGLEKLSSLRTLEEFKVGNGYNKFGYLKNLNQLEGILWIKLFEVNEGDFDTAILENKTHIRALALSFYSFRDESANYASIIESLQPPPNLKCLALKSYPHCNLPSWIVTLNSLRILAIGFGNIASLPALGKLPSLEELSLDRLDDMEFLGREFLGITEFSAIEVAFPKLKKLGIFKLQNLRMWEDKREEDENVVSAIMPCLQELTIELCPRFENLPSWIASLNNLRRLEIRGNKVASLPALYKLPSLEELILDDLEGLMFLGREFFGIIEIPAVQVSFPKLKNFYIHRLENLRIWEDIGEEDENVVSAIMPRLQNLQVVFCPVLENLPNHLLSSKAENVTLYIYGCPRLQNLPRGLQTSG